MKELSMSKKMKIIKLYFDGYSYGETANKTGVSKGSVGNLVAALKEGQFPEISSIPEEIEQLRDLANDIKRSGIPVVQATIGLSLLSRLKDIGIEPAVIEKCHTLLQALSSPDNDLKEMAKSVLAIEDVRQENGLTLNELEAKAISLREETRRLEPLSEEVERKEGERAGLESMGHKLNGKIKDLNDRHNSLTNSISSFEIKESKLANRVADLEERAFAADKQLCDARKDLQALSKIGMSIDNLSIFTSKLKDISAHHTIKSDELGNRLFKELRRLDKGLNLESLARMRKAQLAAIDSEIAQKQTTAEELTASVDQLNSNRLKLESQLAESRKHIAQDISALSNASKDAIKDINNCLKSGIENGMSEVHKLTDEALKVGKEVGKLESSIEYYSWIKPLLSIVRGDTGLDSYQVRVIGLTVLRSMSSWLNEIYGQGSNYFLLKSSIESSISELERWKS